MKKILLLITLLALITSCRSIKKEETKKEIQYELITILRDSLVITYEKKESIIERVIEKTKDKKEKADSYKRTDKDGTVHEFNKYNTEIKTDEKTIENVKELTSKYYKLETKFDQLQEKYNELKEESKKEKKFNYSLFFLICFGIILCASLICILFKYKTSPFN